MRLRAQGLPKDWRARGPIQRLAWWSRMLGWPHRIAWLWHGTDRVCGFIRNGGMASLSCGGIMDSWIHGCRHGQTGEKSTTRHVTQGIGSRQHDRATCWSSLDFCPFCPMMQQLQGTFEGHSGDTKGTPKAHACVFGVSLWRAEHQKKHGILMDVWLASPANPKPILAPTG